MEDNKKEVDKKTSKGIKSRKVKDEKVKLSENDKDSLSDKNEKQIKDEGTILEKKEEVREIIVEKKSGFNYAEVIVIMIITIILGSVIGSFITYILHDYPNNNKCIENKKIPNELEEFVNIYQNIINDYYEEIDHNKLLESGIEGMLNYLEDDYSFYMNSQESESFNEQVEGKYTGIGVEIVQLADDTVQIYNVFDGTPAEVAGLKKGDIFISINDESVAGLTSSEISNKIKNGDSSVKITVLRDSENLDFTLTLKEVELESVTSKVFEKNGNKIGYLGVSVFAANTYTQFERKLLELEGKNIDSLIIDVRDNSGGYLSTVTDMASLFMKKDKIIYQLDTKGVVEQIYSNSNTSRKYNIVVLINRNSASASEILASALQESYKATLIGENSYGKGTVQKAYQLDSGATYKYTIQKWLTPNGNWIHEVGITPNIKVELDEEYYQNPSDDTDNQLQKALEELAK